MQNLFRLKFIEDKSNVVLLGGVGLGKTHLATALGYEACLKGYSVLFSTAIDTINTLIAAQSTGRSETGAEQISQTEPFGPWTSLGIYPSIKPVLICSFRLSVTAMNTAL